MSCCGGETGGNTEDAAKSEQINKILREDKKKLDNEIKLLLLGAGESGKSTIAKQMKIIHREGFSGEEKKSYKAIIFNNVVGAMRVIVNAAYDMKINIENKEAADRIINGGEEYFAGPLSPEIAADIKALWQDPGVQESFKQSAKYQLIDSAEYYFSSIDRLADVEYQPNDQDVLRSRAKTTGIIEIEFEVEKTNFRMVDVGGQRSERKKWMHCFQDVTAVIFCVAMSEYDLKLQEDDKTNRMHESLKLFKEICNSKWFQETSMILFLNKRDLFTEKIQKVDLKVCFEEYNGGLNYKNASTFITEKFNTQNESTSKVIYTHITCATDTDNITVVFKAVKDIILRKFLEGQGF